MALEPLKILISGGGTGGHVYPALATLDALAAYVPVDVLYVGTRQGIEARLVKQRQLPFRAIWIAGFQRSLSWKNIVFPLKLAVSLWQSWRIIRSFRPQVAVGTGGYVTGPLLWMAAQMDIPVVIEEQDVYPGVTTRLLASAARKICLAYPESSRYFAAHQDKIEITGNPVRKDLLSVSREEARNQLNIPSHAPVVLVFGGSQGAQAINNALLHIYSTLVEQNIYLIWQTGTQDYHRVTRVLRENQPQIKVLKYIEDMPAAYAAADIVVCRAGAITLAELAIVQKPAILIPYPYATGDHQLKNARMVEQKGAAITLPQDEHFEEQLLETVLELLADKARQRKMRQAWQALAHPEAADKIARIILEVAGLSVNNTVQTLVNENP